MIVKEADDISSFLAEELVVVEARYRSKWQLPEVLELAKRQFGLNYGGLGFIFFDLIIVESSALWKAIYLSLFKGILGKIKKVPPVIGSLVFFNPKRKIKVAELTDLEGMRGRLN